MYSPHSSQGQRIPYEKQKSTKNGCLTAVFLNLTRWIPTICTGDPGRRPIISVVDIVIVEQIILIISAVDTYGVR